MIERLRKSFEWRMGKIAESIPRWRVIYLCSYWYGLVLKKISPGISPHKTPEEIKTVAVVFSTVHFDPTIDDPTRKNATHNVSNVVRNMHHVFEGKEVYYFDKDKKSEEIDTDTLPKFDLIVGILSKNYQKVAKRNPQAKKVLLLMNSSPFFRARVMLQESKRIGKRISRGEWVKPSQLIRHLPYTDKVLLLGDEYIKSTFTEIPHPIITTINAGVNNDLLYPDTSKRPENKIRVLYLASYLGIRKGLFRVFEIWETLNKNHAGDFELVIVGGLDNSFKKDMDSFLERNPNVRFVGWLESNTIEYRDMLQSSHIILCPSLEEGQVGCVLEAMATGAVPVITDACGVPIKNGVEGYISSTTDSEAVVKYLADALMKLLDKDQLKLMSQKSLTHIETFHTWNKFKEIVRKVCLED